VKVTTTSDRAGSLVPHNLPRLSPEAIGRDEELAAVEAALAEHRRVALLASVPAALGGFGVSTVALAFAWRALHAGTYPGGVFWVHASGAPSQALARLAAELRASGPAVVRDRLAEEPADASPDEAARAARRALQDQREPSLLVLDDVDAEGFPDRVPLGEVRVIMVPREARFAFRKKLAVPPLSAAASADLARELGARPRDAADRLALEALASRELGGAAVAIKLAARYIAHSGRSWTAYATRLRTQARVMVDDRGLPEGYAESVVAAVDASIQLHPEGSAPRGLLTAASAFAPHAAPIAWVSAAADLDDASAEAALAPLVDLGLVALDPAARTISMHRFVHRRVRDLAGDDAWRATSRRAAAGVAVWLAEGAPAAGEIDARRPHVDEALAAADRAGSDLAWVIIADRVGVDLERHGRFEEARDLLTRALARAERLDPPDPGQVRVCLSNLAGLLVEMGEPREARPLLERAIAIDDDPKDEAPSSVRLSKLSRALSDVGQKDAARPLLEHVLAPTRHPCEPAASSTLPEVARVLHELKHAPGGGFIDRALAGPEGGAPDVATLLRTVDQSASAPATSDGAPTASELTSLGLSLYALGHPGDARPLLERALASDLAIHGPDHPEVAGDLMNLSAVLRSLGERDKARAYLEQAKAIVEQALPEDDPLRVGIESRLDRV
jgi:tetratricopeptide (TPR) repeat protein